MPYVELNIRYDIPDRTKKKSIRRVGKDSSGSQGSVLLLGTARVGIYVDGFGKTSQYERAGCGLCCEQGRANS